VYEGGNAQIAWDLQGVRHMGGLKVWGPYQQARFLVGLRQRDNISATDLAQISGIGRTTVSRLLRSYNGFMQAVADVDHGDQISRQDFSIFQEAIFHRNDSPIAVWLGWSDELQRFENGERLTTLLSLLKTTDDNGSPRIARVNPDLRDKFSKLLTTGHEAALELFLSEEATLDAALQRVVREDESAHVRDEFVDVDVQLANLSTLLERLSALPLPKIVNEGRVADFIDKLTSIREALVLQLGFLSSATATPSSGSTDE
jgi:transcriptional regulator with XRE-family HTH domain